LAIIWGETIKDHLGYINVEREKRKATIFPFHFPVMREEVTPEYVSVSATEYQYMGKGGSLYRCDAIILADCLTW
jgi:hypothetical protein